MTTETCTMEDPKDSTPGTLPTRAERPRRPSPPRSRDTSLLPEGYRLGNYRVLRPLGAGGMGTVYEAAHLEMGKRVALKVLSADRAADPQARARFLREAEAASRIQHPHVVNVTDYGTAEGVPFIVMQLLRGEDLGCSLDRHPRGLPIPEVADTLLAVCAGVFAAHQAGVIHRDLKPRNIFLARVSPEEVRPQVLDFGISKVTGLLPTTALTDPGAVIGTTHYLAPEQIEGADVDARTDQHALGVVIYECVTGRRPFEGDSAQAIMRSIHAGRFVPPTRLRPDLPGALERVILRALAREPADRFATVDDLGRALLSFASARKRIAWADFYRGPAQDEARSPGDTDSLSGEKAVPGSPDPPAAPTVLLPRPGPDRSETRTRKRHLDRARPDSRQPPAQAPEPARSAAATGSEEGSPSPPPRRAWWTLVVLGVLLMITGARLITRVMGSGPRISDQQPQIVETSRPPVVLQAPPSPALAEQTVLAPAEPPPTALPAEVTIHVADARAGLVATLDGRAVDLPMKLPRGSAPVSVIFSAPGYQPRRITIVPDADQTLPVRLTLRLKRRVASARPRPAKPAQPSPPDPPPEQPRPGLSPGPIIDP